MFKETRDNLAQDHGYFTFNFGTNFKDRGCVTLRFCPANEKEHRELMEKLIAVINTYYPSEEA